MNSKFTIDLSGPHKIDVLYDGVPVPGSPFPVNARRGCDPRKVKAFGPGLERGVVNQPNIFTIETKGEFISFFRKSKNLFYNWLCYE